MARLRAAHTAAALLTVAAAVGTSAARFDHRPGGPALLDALGRLLEAALVAAAVGVVWVVCRRGRSERRLDRELDARLVRRLPLAALVLLVLAAVYAGWERPGWESVGRLPGDATFGGIALVQGLLVIALGAVAHVLYRTHPDPRAAMRGLAGPAVAMLACALGGVMSGGVSQRVADWLDGTGTNIPGPPVLLTWQASVIPPLLVVLLVLGGWLAWRTWLLRRAAMATVEQDYPSTAQRHHPHPPHRPRPRGGHAHRPGAPARRGHLHHDPPPRRRRPRRRHDLRQGTRRGRTADALLRRGRRRDRAGAGLLADRTRLHTVRHLGPTRLQGPSARRTIGILWDVGTFWPRAAHPFAPPCYAERAVPDLTWRMETWTRATAGRLVISGHSQGSVLAAAAAWQLTPSVRKRVGLLTYGSPLERLYGRWFPAHFGPAALSALHHDVDCWRNLHRPTDPIGGPVGLTGDCGPEVDREPLKDPLAYGRTDEHPLPAPILGHSDYQADPAFAEERARLLARLHPGVPAQRPQDDSGRSSA